MLVPSDDAELVALGHSATQTTFAAAAASRRIREAMARYWTPLENLEDYDEELAALIRQHGVALAKRDLTAEDQLVPLATIEEAKRAEAWLAELKAGDIDLSSSLAPRASASGRGRQISVVGTADALIDSSVFDPVVT